MKMEMEATDIQAIAREVAGLISPLLSGKNNQNEDEILDVQGLAAYLKTSVKWIYERTHLKEIPHYKARGLLRFRKKEIDKWLSGSNIPATNRPDRLNKKTA